MFLFDTFGFRSKIILLNLALLGIFEQYVRNTWYPLFFVIHITFIMVRTICRTLYYFLFSRLNSWRFYDVIQIVQSILSLSIKKSFMIKRKPRKQKAAKDEVGRAIVEQSKHELFLKINEKRFFFSWKYSGFLL